MTRDQAAEINTAAYALLRLCRRYGADDTLRAHAMNAARLSDEAVDALPPANIKEDKVA